MLKWKGFGDEENLWVPIENLNCPALLEEFEDNLKKSRKKLLSKPDAKKKPIKEVKKKSKKVEMQSSSSKLLQSSSKKNSKANAAASNLEVTSNNNAQSPSNEEPGSQSKSRGKQDIQSAIKLEPSVSQSTAIALPEEVQIPSGTGFDRGLEAECVIGAKMTPQGRVLVIKWKGKDKIEQVAAEEANKKIPQLVIEYYESRCQWDV